MAKVIIIVNLMEYFSPIKNNEIFALVLLCGIANADMFRAAKHLPLSQTR